jgi:hypothetical protein
MRFAMNKDWTTHLILQLPCHGQLGNARDLEFRHELEAVMKDYFAQSQIGCVDGGDIGMGKMNVFLYTSPADSPRVLKALESVIQFYKLENHAVVARLEANDDDDDAPTVLYPTTFKGEFSVL